MTIAKIFTQYSSSCTEYKYNALSCGRQTGLQCRQLVLSLISYPGVLLLLLLLRLQAQPNNGQDKEDCHGEYISNDFRFTLACLLCNKVGKRRFCIVLMY